MLRNMTDLRAPIHDANSDEAHVPPYAPHALGLDIPGETLASRQACWRDALAKQVYGPIPSPPDSITIARDPAEGRAYDRLMLTLRRGPRDCGVDAALWLPPRASGPVPLIVGLSFLGPAGVLVDDTFPLDREAVVDAPPDLGLVNRQLAGQVRGMHASRWPLPLILGAGFGLLLSCYGSWVPDCPDRYRSRGVWPVLALDGGNDGPGALSMWAWALQRLVDVACRLDVIDSARITLAGHSRLGKAALWAAANDERVAAVLVNNGGCLGPALSCRDYGETPRLLTAAYPHWASPRLAAALCDGGAPGVDQHALIASIAPRNVYIASASDDWWADPRGEYEGLRAALPAWQAASPTLPPWEEVALGGTTVFRDHLGWHLRPGGHGLSPWDWQRFLAFLTGASPPSV